MQSRERGTPVLTEQEVLDPVADRAMLRRLARWCRRYSPVVGLEDAEHPETILIDIAGCAHLFGGETRLAQRVLHDVTRFGLTAYVAIADTIGAAWGASFCAARKSFPSPTVIPAGRQEIALQSLPVSALRLPPAVLETLYELDLNKIGQLLRLPRETLPSRFGAELLKRLDQALGNAPELIVAEPPEEPIEARWGCEEPIENALAIVAVLRRLLRRAVRIAKARGEGILRIEVLLAGAGEEPLRIAIDCVRPTLRRKHLIELIRLQLERIPLRAGVVDFLLRVTASAPLDESQPDLFGEENQRDTRRELDSLLNRLTSRLGRAAVLRPELRADYQPERAMSFRPVVDVVKSKTKGAEVPVLRTRPVRVRPQPLPVSVTSLIPDGPPIRLHLQRADHQIVHCDGPERIETGWWRQAPIRRDYYRIDLDSGERHWLFRSLEDGRWFLHGDY